MAARTVHAIKAKWAVPHHYKTFPILTQDAKLFIKALSQWKVSGVEMQPGSTIVFEGNKLKKQ